MSSRARSVKRNQQRRLARTRTIAGATALALGGLASGYFQALRPSVAYAATTCEAGDEAALNTCLTGLPSSGAVTVSITADMTLTSDLSQADLTTGAFDLTIDGNGHTIDGAGNAAFDLAVDGNDTVVVSDLTITDTSAGFGSGILVSGGAASVTLERVTIERAYADYNGGAVYAVTDLLTINSSVFRDDSTAGAGGAIHASNYVEITSSLFEGNYSGGSDGGGAIYSDSDLSVSNSFFVGNEAAGDGGAVRSENPVAVTGSVFDRNTSAEKGGAIWTYDATIYDSSFIGNSSDNRGGAVYVSDHLQLVNSQFIENVAVNGGGGLYMDSAQTVDVRQSTFQRNSAPNGGAILLYDGGGLGAEISSSSFIQNVAAEYGGAINSQFGLAIDNSTFLANSAGSSGGKGGAIYVFGNELVTEVNFSTFVANTADDSGSALFFQIDNPVAQPLRLQSTGTVFDDTAGTAYVCATDGTLVVDDSYVFSTGSSANCSFDGLGSDDTFATGDFELGPLQDNGGPTDTLLPSVTSPLVTRAPATNLGSGVTSDQRGAARPFAPYDYTIGAVQLGSEAAPGAPTDAPSATAGAGSASVNTPTGANGGTPTSWRITAYTVDDSYLIPTDDSCVVTGSTGSCTVNGLTGGQPYKFKAVPSNAQGDGRPSIPSNQVTPSAAPTPTPPGPTPTPTPVYPPSAPREVEGVPGDRSVAVSWLAPTSSGSFPISNYLVTASPGGASCLTATLSCTVSGLINGQPYTFTVKALNGAGWGANSAASAPVVPSGVTPEPVAIVLDEGTRTAANSKDRIRTGGTTTGIESGVKLTPWIRYSGQDTFTEGKATITVQADGSFTWTRLISKKRGLTAYVSYLDTESNRVTWQRIR